MSVKIKEYKVGEIFEYGNDYAEVVESFAFNCSYCICLGWTICLPCTKIVRSDEKTVYYRIISKNEIRKLKLNQIDNL